MIEKEIIRRFKNGFESTINIILPKQQHLFFELIPSALLQQKFEVIFNCEKIKWNDDSSVFKEENNKNTFQINCQIKGKLAINGNLIYPPKDFEKNVVVNFKADSPLKDNSILGYEIVTQELSTIQSFLNLLIDERIKLQIKTIEEYLYPGTTAFGFFTDILRKARNTKPKNDKISNMDFFNQISLAHFEVREIILRLSIFRKYIAKPTDTSQVLEGKTIYYPRLLYYDYMFLMDCNFVCERLYTYWDRIIFLLHNFYDANIDESRVSFDSYFKKIDGQISANYSGLTFNRNSDNLKWFLAFWKKDFKEIEEKRHRIVHFKITDDWQGLYTPQLLSKIQNTQDLNELIDVQGELYSFLDLFIEHFNLCKIGFDKALALIDELP